MIVDVIENLDALANLRRNWDALYDKDPEAHFYMSWVWIWNWFDRFDVPWLVLAAKPEEHADYVAFFPLHVGTVKKDDSSCCSILRTGGSPFAVVTGIVCDPEFAQDAISAFGRHLDSFHWWRLQFDTFAVSKERAAWLQAPFQRPGIRQRNVVVSFEGDTSDHFVYPFLRLPEDFESFIATLGSATRKNARTYLRQLEAGEFRITEANEETLERDLDILMGFWEMRWGQHRQGERNNYRKMLRRCFKEGCAFLPVLWQGDKPIGAKGQLIDRSKRTVIALIGTRDATVKRPPPSFVLQLHCIRWAIANGFAIYDLLLGDYQHKYFLHPEERHIEGLWIEKTDQRNAVLDKRSIPTLLKWAKQSHADGKALEAARISSQILELEPAQSDARNLLFRLASELSTEPRVAS